MVATTTTETNKETALDEGKFSAKVFLASQMPEVIKCCGENEAMIFEYVSDYDKENPLLIVAVSKLQAYRAAVEKTSSMKQLSNFDLCKIMSSK